VERNLKYECRTTVQKAIQDKEIGKKPYFGRWLSGFIEAKGCFCIRQSSISFSIGQKYDLYLLETIKSYRGALNKIQHKKQYFFLLEVYRQSVLKFLKSHFENNPLLGEKKLQYCFFVQKIKS
jgi:hypothetical protein